MDDAKFAKLNGQSQPVDPMPLILVVGDKGQFAPVTAAIAKLDRTEFSSFQSCTTALTTLAPDIVLSPLVADGFDAAELATLLHIEGFQGRFRIVGVTLPDMDLVLTELRQAAPTLDIDFMVFETADPLGA